MICATFPYLVNRITFKIVYFDHLFWACTDKSSFSECLEIEPPTFRVICYYTWTALGPVLESYVLA